MDDTKAAEVDNILGEDTVKEEEKVVIEPITPLLISVNQSALKQALDVLFTNKFGNQLNRKIYALQKELKPYSDEYRHLLSKIEEDPKNVEDGKYTKEGILELADLNATQGAEKIELKTELPIKVRFLDCFSSNDRMVLETFGIAEFEEE